MNEIKGYSGIFLVGIGALSIFGGIILGIHNPSQYSEFAVTTSLGGVVITTLGNLIVQNTTEN